MLIQSIKLENFRQFKGKQKIEFSCDKNKNVTIVMGENGAGKTTLEQAFLWCLYGVTEFKVKELINREVREDAWPKDICSVSVELHVVHEGRSFRITRKQRLTKGVKNDKPEEMFVVSTRDENGDWKDCINEIASDAKIKELLPRDLSGFFFFDGERIETMSKELLEKKKSSDFENAVKGLVGLSAIQSAIEHFGSTTRKNTVIGKFNQEISSTANAKISAMEAEIERLASQIEQDEKDRKQLESEVHRFVRDYEKWQKELSDMSDDIKRREQYEQYKRDLKNRETRLRDSQKQFLKSFSLRAEVAFSQPMLQAAMLELKDADKLDKGIPHIHVDTIKFLLNRGRCVCGTSLVHDEEKIKILRELMKHVPPHEIGQMVGDFSSNIKQRANELEEFWGSFDFQMKQMRELSSEIDMLNNNISDLVNDMADQSKVQVLKKKMNEAKSHEQKAGNEYRQAISRLSQRQARLNTLESDRMKLLSENERNQINLRYLRYAKRVCDILRENYMSKEMAVRQELEDTINHIFEDIYDGGIQLHVSEKYNVTTTVTDTYDNVNGDNLEQNTAQSYAIIFAFISGIITMAKKPDDFGKEERSQNPSEGYPLVMDAPLSSFDKKRIHRICKALPEIAEQVIIFIKDTDGETAEEHLADKIGCKWKLEPKTKTYTVIEKRA
ncbi:MAG: AAA family ATPase [Selenomonadaceae bacterium]|nr:AAA family ATPase [Selenomonadaceae bacterium]